MTIKECIDIVDNIKPNQYTVADKVNWLTFVDMTIINDVLKTHEGYDGRYDLFEGYSPDKLTASLVVPTPYDRLYTAYLSMQIDRLNGETAKYNNSASLYNTYLLEYKRYYNKTHMPLDITRKGYGEKPPKKHTVGLTAAEYENLKRDLYFALSADVNEVISPDKLYDIVTSYAYNNIEMLKGADGKTPVRGVDYFTEVDVEDMVNEVLAYENIKFAEIDADMGKVNEKLGLHAGNKDNPHKVTAEQVGAYSKEETNRLLDDKVSLDDLFKETSFKLTDFDYNVSSVLEGYKDYVYEDYVSSPFSQVITIYCKGKTLGFTAYVTSEGSDTNYARMTVNGTKVIDNHNSMMSFTTEPVLMTEDIIIELNGDSIYFSNMVQKVPIIGGSGGGGDIVIDKVLDVNSDNAIANSAVANAIGDIDAALDELHSYAQSLVGGGAV